MCMRMCMCMYSMCTCERLMAALPVTAVTVARKRPSSTSALYGL